MVTTTAYRDHLAQVLRVAPVVLLAVPVARAGLGRHDDARLRAVYTRLPGALGADDLAVLILLGVLTEVPDCAVVMLGVPVEGVLDDLAVATYGVVNLDARYPEHRPDARGDHHDGGLDAVLGPRPVFPPHPR